MLAAVQTSIAGLLTAPGSASLALARDLPALAAVAPDNPAGYAAALATLLGDYVAAIATDAAAAATPDASAPPGYQDASRLAPTPADPSYGLAALGDVGAALVPAAGGQVAANWTALMQVVQGSAVAALMLLYAQTIFAAAEDADAARGQVNALIVAQIEAAAGNDALVQSWRAALVAIVDYLTATAKQVPDVETITTASPLPALVLAQMLYQDGTQAAVLAQRNAAPHPLFMPLSVEYLAP
jgi:hypothetical protein